MQTVGSNNEEKKRKETMVTNDSSLENLGTISMKLYPMIGLKALLPISLKSFVNSLKSIKSKRSNRRKLIKFLRKHYDSRVKILVSINDQIIGLIGI